MNLEDLASLEPEYLRHEFRPMENGMTPFRLALALCRHPLLLAHVLGGVPQDLASAIRDELDHAPDASDEEIAAAELELIGVYLWQIAYRCYPADYDAFSAAQRFAFDRLFPLRDHAGRAVLDIGCGTGKLTAYVARSAAIVWAVDAIVPMLRVARSKLAPLDHVHVAAGTFHYIPLASESVDAVVSNLAFQMHAENGGDAGLRELARVLRSGGQLRLTVGNTATQDFLVKRGFSESFVPLGVRSSPPAGESIVARCLYELSRRGLSGSAESSSRHYLCAAGPWKLRWTIRNALQVLGGTPLRELFFRGRLTLPLGLPVYSWRKP